MRARWRYGLVLAGGYLVFLAASVPARLALSRVPLPPTLTLTGVHGSIWSGRAVLMHTGAGPRVLSHLRFHVWPGALLHARWGYAVRATGPVGGHFAVASGGTQMMLADVVLQAPVKVLRPLIGGLRGMGARGTVTVHSRRVVFGAHPHGGGVVTWRHAGLASLPVDPLGSYRIGWRVTPAGLSYSIHTLRGRLAIAGGGRWQARAGVVSFHGIMTPHGLRLQGFFSSLGTAAPGGARRIHLRLPAAAL